jgi:uridine kinase
MKETLVADQMNLYDQNRTVQFESYLYDRLQQINPGIGEMEPLEFGYALETLNPEQGWQSVTPRSKVEFERLITTREFYESIQLRPKQDGRLVMDMQVRRLTQELLAGLVSGVYEPKWVIQHFTFDIRGFYFLHRTMYFTQKINDHLGGEPFVQYEKQQKQFRYVPSVGYKQFKAANAEVDGCLIDLVHQLVALKGTPILIAIAGQTAAGKTEIVERLRSSLITSGKNVTSLEMDNFFTDRDEREAKGIDSIGKEALHFEIFKQCLTDICQGKRIIIPQYNFKDATSSHDLEGQLKPGHQPLEIESADIIFMEGNFPFLLPEIANLIDIKVMYLTDDVVRMQRKWKRDMDYHKKYELMYFLNRYFREQYLMAESVYRPQMALCDVLVHTTGAAIWITPQIRQLLTGI